jgi:hypothetical protein
VLFHCVAYTITPTYTVEILAQVGTSTLTSKVVRSAQVLSCLLKSDCIFGQVWNRFRIDRLTTKKHQDIHSLIHIPTSPMIQAPLQLLPKNSKLKVLSSLFSSKFNKTKESCLVDQDKIPALDLLVASLECTVWLCVSIISWVYCLSPNLESVPQDLTWL